MDRRSRVRFRPTERSTSGAFSALPVTWASRTEEANGRTSPEELLAAAHASCFSMAFSSELAKAGSPPEYLEVSSEVTFDRIDGKWTVVSSKLTVRGRVPGLDDGRFRAIAGRPRTLARSREPSSATSPSASTPRSTSRRGRGRKGARRRRLRLLLSRYERQGSAAQGGAHQQLGIRDRHGGRTTLGPVVRHIPYRFRNAARGRAGVQGRPAGASALFLALGIILLLIWLRDRSNLALYIGVFVTALALSDLLNGAGWSTATVGGRSSWASACC